MAHPELPHAPAGRLAALRIPGFRLFVLARFASATGHTLGRAAIAWQLYALTGSELQLGVLGLVQFGPTLALSLVAGAFADAHDRVRIVRACQTVSLLAAAALLVATTTGTISPLLIYGVVLVSATATAFENPSGASLLPALVPREIFAHAVTLNSSLRNAGRLLGPAAFGFVVYASDLAAAYGAQALLFALSVVCLFGVHPRSEPEARTEASWAAVREGLSFLRQRPAILGAMSLDMVAVIFGGAVALLPVYATEILDVGPRGYGMLAAALDLGTMLMAVILIALPPIRRAGRSLFFAVGVFGLATIVFGASTSFAVSIAALVVAGMADQISVISRHLIIQLATPDALRGRVNSVNLLFIGASNELGAAESGFLAAATSAPFSVVFGGFACLAALGTAWVGVPSLRRYDTSEPGPDGQNV